MDIITVYKLLESRRSELNNLAKKYDVRDQRLLVKSVELDRIINMYMKKFHEVGVQHHIQNKGIADISCARELIGTKG
ncbi:hypothetical protein J2T13_004076 [Paenibacillus sp. DS2015]|uniref:Spo0E family sporulation regulatory protein-aspartic acid phosphatase n=1 Tax=Paenibacillus sp. DS2015 TaxID=3373917 RepID=UPI003D21C0E2